LAPKIWLALTYLLSGLGSDALAQTSWLDRLLLLRFADERVVRAHQGELDLGGLKAGDYWHVQGEVLFVPGEFLEPRMLGDDEWQAMINNPNNLRADLKLKPFPFPLQGTDSNYGTFVLRIRHAPQGDWTIRMLRGYHPFLLTVATKERIKPMGRLGTVARDPEKNRSWGGQLAIAEALPAAGDLYLFMHASSQLHEGKNTLNMSSFLLGSGPKLEHTLDISEFLIRAIVGSFFIMALFYGFIYSFRPQDRSSLYLSGYALTLFVMSGIFTTIVPLHPLQATTIISGINILSVALLELYLLDKIRSYVSARQYRFGLIFTASLTFISLTAQVFQAKLLIGLSFLLMTGFSFFLIIATLTLGIRHKLDGVIFFIIGTLLNLGLQLPVLGTMIGLRPGEYGFGLILANFGMALSLALVNAREFAVTYRRSIRQSQELEEKNAQITFFNKNLESLVAQKTEQIRSLLDYIPQGVLSIENEGLIGTDYSAHLNEILPSSNIAKQSFKSLVLDRSSLSADCKDQAWQSILSAIGENEVNWEVNSDKLPRELPLIYGQDTRYFKVTWNPKIKEDIVQNVLVTLLDITQEKAFEKDAESQRQEMKIIQELISVAPSGLAQFFETSEGLLQEMGHILQSAQDSLEPRDVRLLFVNAHTVKGAARTLHLSGLAEALHLAEEGYSSFLRNQVPLDLEAFRIDHQQVIRTYLQYKTINSEKLNRGADLNKISLSRKFVERQYQLIQKLMEDVNQPVSSFLDSLRSQSEQLTDIVFDHLPTLFEDYKTKGTRIARDLGKEAPNFVLSIPDTVISRDMHMVLDHCMIHILRNALDHGIETAEERKAAGKNIQGCIRIEGSVMDDRFLTLVVSDDGRGLAIARLREKGLELGRLTQSSSVQEAAELIFASGLSTAKKVSNISGRGVGMDAVRSYLEKAGGQVNLRIGTFKDAEGTFCDFALVITLPLDRGDDPMASGF
jgi:hypothetical protein